MAARCLHRCTDVDRVADPVLTAIRDLRLDDLAPVLGLGREALPRRLDRGR